MVKIMYSKTYKGVTHTCEIIVKPNVDYAYFKAIFDALIELGLAFTVEPDNKEAEID